MCVRVCVCVCVCVCVKTRVVLLLHCTKKVYSEKGYLLTIFSVQHLNTRIYTHI